MNYFTGDYKAIGGTNPFAGISVSKDLFNGNIKAMAVNISKLNPIILHTSILMPRTG